jgi:hypothetical protein
MATWSATFEGSIGDDGAAALCKALINEIKKRPPAERSLAFSIADVDQHLFGDALPDDLAASLRIAIATGVLRLRQPVDRRRVPDRFFLSRALLPARDLPLLIPAQQPLRIDLQFLKRFLRPSSGGQRPEPGTETFDRVLSLYLSTSFASLEGHERDMLKATLSKAVLRPTELTDEKLRQPMHLAIAKFIRPVDAVVLNAGNLTPYAMFEAGTAAGLKKPKVVAAIFNHRGELRRAAEIPSYLLRLPVVTYDGGRAAAEAMAAKLRTELKFALGRKSEFEHVELANVRLRPRTTRERIYLAYPPHLNWAYRLVRERLETEGRQVFEEDDAGIFNASALQIPVRCVYMSGIVIVDTTGPRGLTDLLQSFKVGVALAKPNTAVLRVENGVPGDMPRMLSHLSVPVVSWANIEDLSERISRFVRDVLTRGGGS